MTDIRKHGFDSDTQWREHLAEIEEAAASSTPIEVQEPTVIQELADLRRQLAALRAQIHTRVQHQRSRRHWWTIGASATLLFLMAASRPGQDLTP